MFELFIVFDSLTLVVVSLFFPSRPVVVRIVFTAGYHLNEGIRTYKLNGHPADDTSLL